MDANRNRGNGVSFLIGGTIACAIFIIATFGVDTRAQQFRFSPHETASSTVGAATITIVYGRPTMRGRIIFGKLVPFDRLWMPGADEATLFTTSAPLRFGRAALPAGRYSLYTIPRQDAWTLIINRQTGQWHTEYHQGQDLVRLPLQVEPRGEPLERLTISATPRKEGGGVLAIEWERTRASIPFRVTP